jgi:hypothetical protein
MFTKKRASSHQKRYYRIIVEGRIDPSWSEWLDDFQLDSKKEGGSMYLTTISGIVTDQPALRGLLNRLWDLNLVLRSIQQVGPTDYLEKK